MRLPLSPSVLWGFALGLANWVAIEAKKAHGAQMWSTTLTAMLSVLGWQHETASAAAPPVRVVKGGELSIFPDANNRGPRIEGRFRMLRLAANLKNGRQRVASVTKRQGFFASGVLTK